MSEHDLTLKREKNLAAGIEVITITMAKERGRDALEDMLHSWRRQGAWWDEPELVDGMWRVVLTKSLVTPGYSFLPEAAEEARAASRKYWAPGGYADRKYPVQPMPWWPEPGAKTGGEAANDRASKRRGK